MGIGTGGTFASDAQKIGMNAHDIQELVETFPTKKESEGGMYPYKFKNRDYLVKWKRSGSDIELTSITLK